jgi:hypothetical protein
MAGKPLPYLNMHSFLAWISPLAYGMTEAPATSCASKLVGGSRRCPQAQREGDWSRPVELPHSERHVCGLEAQ